MWRENFFSVYESTDFVLPETHLSGFCLTCRLQSDANKTLLYSMDCNENAAGHCVVRNGEALSLPPIMSTFASYWRYCRNQNTYIVGDITQTFCQKDISIWTGLRKFYIENSNIAIDSCYIIEVHNQTVTYKERNCTEPHFFLCKQEISREFVTSIPKINTTKTQHHRLLLELRGQPKQFLQIRVCLPMQILLVISNPLTKHRL